MIPGPRAPTTRPSRKTTARWYSRKTLSPLSTNAAKMTMAAHAPSIAASLQVKQRGWSSVGCCGSDGSCGGEGMGSGGGGAPSSSILRSPRSTRSTMKSPIHGAGKKPQRRSSKGCGQSLLVPPEHGGPDLTAHQLKLHHYPTRSVVVDQVDAGADWDQTQCEPVLSPAARRRQGTSPLPRVLGADSERGPPCSTRTRSRFGA